MADQPNVFHVTDAYLGEMQLLLSLIVYSTWHLNTGESLEWERGKNLATVYIIRHIWGNERYMQQ